MKTSRSSASDRPEPATCGTSSSPSVSEARAASAGSEASALARRPRSEFSDQPSRAPSDDSNAPRLALDSHQDALDDAAAFVEECNRRHVESRIPNVAESYCRGDLELVIRVVVAGIDVRQNNLVIRAVTSTDAEARARTFDFQTGRQNSCFKQDLMLHRVSQLVQTPQGFITSLIRFERSHEVENRLGNVDRSTLAVSISLADGIVPEWEVGVIPVLTVCASGGVSELIQRGPQIVSGVSGNAPESPREGLTESEAKMAVSRIASIHLTNNFVRVGLQEDADKRFEFSDVFLRVLDSPARAV